MPTEFDSQAGSNARTTKLLYSASKGAIWRNPILPPPKVGPEPLAAINPVENRKIIDKEIYQSAKFYQPELVWILCVLYGRDRIGALRH